MNATVEPMALARSRHGPVALTLARVVSTGFPGLDQMIPGGGWPRGGVIELICDPPNAEVMAVLLPTLALLSQDKQQRWLACIAPPEFPDATVLAKQGVDLTRLLLVESHTVSQPVAFAERTLGAKTCAALLLWAETIDAGQLTQLQEAADDADTLLFLLRPARTLAMPSTACLRLSVNVRHGRLQIRVLQYRDNLNSLLVLGPDQALGRQHLQTAQERLQQRRAQLRAVTVSDGLRQA